MSPGYPVGKSFNTNTFKPFLVLALLGVFFVQGLLLIQKMSPTADEVAFNMVNGYTYLKTHDYRMTPANPPLTRQWMAAPWLFMDLKLDLDKPSWSEADSLPFGQEFFYKDNRASAEKLLFISRFMVLLLGLGTGLVVYLWAQALHGARAGFLALVLFAFCPNVLAHSALATTDIGVTLFSTLAAFFLWRELTTSKPVDRWAFLVTFALACAAKFNALLFGPVFLLVVCLKKGFWEAAKRAVQIALVAFFVIWTSYGFEWKPILGGGVPRVEEKLGYVAEFSEALFPKNEAMKKKLQHFVLTTPIPAPSYLLGMSGIVRSHRSPYRHFAFGRWTTDVQWYYYLFCFAVKMTLPFLLLFLLRFIFFRRSTSPGGLENWVILLPTAAAFATTFGDTTAVGIRYLLPVIPMLFVWVSGLARAAAGSRRLNNGLIVAVGLNLLTTLPFFPNYISYFNPTVGGVEGGHRYVRGSDVDWGQGLKALAAYLKERGIDRVSLEYFGPTDPGYYGIPYEPMSREEMRQPRDKVYAVSLFYLEHAEWAVRLKPTTIVGGSIAVFDFRKRAA